MSKSYTVKSGDTLGAIALKHLGSFSKWTKIRDANPQLANRKKAVDGSPLIFPGDVLIVSDDESIELPKTAVIENAISLDDAAENDISIYIDGKLFTGFTGYTISFSSRELDAFSFSAPWQDEKKELREIFKPFRFKKCAVYYDKKLIFTGTLLTNAPEVSPDSKTINIQGYPLCGVLNDCDIPASKYPPSYKGLNLKQIAEDITSGFSQEVDFLDDAGAEFEKVEYEPGKKCLEFLKGLSDQRGFVYTNNEKGFLKFWKPKLENVSATFKEGELPFFSCKPAFKSQEMFSHITGYSKTDAETDSASFTWENSLLTKDGIFRPTSFVSKDASENDIENEVKARAGKMLAESASYELTVIGHKDEAGNLFRKNMTISVLSPGAQIYRETKFQVEKVVLKRSDTEGCQTTFSLSLPGARDGEILEALPWEN